MDTGSRLRLKRESLGLTRDDVARACGVTVSVVEGWELGAYAPIVPLAHRLACTLGLSLEQVYGFEPIAAAARSSAVAIDGARLHAQLDRVIALLEAGWRGR